MSWGPCLGLKFLHSPVNLCPFLSHPWLSATFSSITDNSYQCCPLPLWFLLHLHSHQAPCSAEKRRSQESFCPIFIGPGTLLVPSCRGFPLFRGFPMTESQWAGKNLNCKTSLSVSSCACSALVSQGFCGLSSLLAWRLSLLPSPSVPFLTLRRAMGSWVPFVVHGAVQVGGCPHTRMTWPRTHLQWDISVPLCYLRAHALLLELVPVLTCHRFHFG